MHDVGCTRPSRVAGNEALKWLFTDASSASAATPTETGTNVCGEICTNTCNEFGQLPPTSDDCQQLVNSITILNGQISESTVLSLS